MSCVGDVGVGACIGDDSGLMCARFASTVAMVVGPARADIRASDFSEKKVKPK